MASALVVSLLKYGLLAALWLFVLAAFRAVRTDLYSTTARTRPAAAPAAAASAAGQRRSAASRLVVTAGPLAGTTLALAGAPVTLGRAEQSTLVLSDDYVSNQHAQLLLGDGAWLLEDLGSTNGTYLSGARVSGPTPVPLGAPVQVGTTVLELR